MELQEQGFLVESEYSFRKRMLGTTRRTRGTRNRIEMAYSCRFFAEDATYIFVKFFTALLYIACSFIWSPHAIAQDSCSRIVSLAPSITETLHTLGLFSRIVGRTSYDTFPDEIKNIPIIGGFLDPSIETIVSLKPTVVVGLAEQEDLLRRLSKLKLSTIMVEHRNVDGILESFASLGSRCGAIEAAYSAANDIRMELQKLSQYASQFQAKKVVVVVSRSYESPVLKDVYLSGKDGYYSSLVEHIGGENVFNSMTGAMTGTSLEGLMMLNPDVIIEVLPPGEISKFSRAFLMSPWRKLKLLRAVREERVFLLDDDWATIPGPRFIVLLRKLCELLHGSAP